MIRVDKVMQRLITDIPTPGVVKTVAADLDVDSIDHLPFITHATQVAQDRNAAGLYSGVLTVNIFLAPADTPLTFVEAIYDGVWSWDRFDGGDMPGVGGVEAIDSEIQAFTRLATAVQMLNKSVTQYVGSWNLTIREH